jgi:hypothetical protein
MWLVFLLGLLAAFQPGEPRDVTVTAHVTSNGVAVKDVPLCFRAWTKQRWAQTNDEGTASVQLPVGSTETCILVVPLIGPQKEGRGDEEYQSHYDRAIAILEAQVFKSIYSVSINPAQTSCSTEISAPPGRSVSVRVIREGRPLRDAVISPSSMVVNDTTERDGQAKVGGVSKGPDSLFVSYMRDTVRVPVPAGDSDVHLGDVELAASAEDLPVSIVVEHQTQLDLTYAMRRTGVTLVSADGLRIISLRTFPKEGGDPATTDNKGTLQRVPAGTYYVAPAEFVGAPAQVRLVDRLARKEKPPGVPYLEVTKAKVASLSFDAVKVSDAILSNK